MIQEDGASIQKTLELLWSCPVFVVDIACTDCYAGCFYITQFEECRSPIRGSRPNLASIDKRLDMMKTHRVMAVPADNRYRFCGGNPVITHDRVSQ